MDNSNAYQENRYTSNGRISIDSMNGFFFIEVYRTHRWIFFIPVRVYEPLRMLDASVPGYVRHPIRYFETHDDAKTYAVSIGLTLEE